MYAGVANQSLKTLSDSNQQLATEQYNKKIAAMQLLQQAIDTDDPELRRYAQESSTRSGLIGRLADIKGLFTPTNDLIKTNASIQSAGGAPIVNPNLQQGNYNSTQGDTLRKLKENYMYTDEKGQRKFDKVGYENQLHMLKIDTSGINEGATQETLNDPKFDIQAHKKVDKVYDPLMEEQIKESENLQNINDKEQSRTDAINKKNNMYINRLKDKGVYHEEFKGNIQEMSGQNRSMFKELYKQAIESKDYDKIAEIRDEYAENQRGINQYWKNDSKIDVSMFKDPRGGKAKQEDRQVQLKYIEMIDGKPVDPNAIPTLQPEKGLRFSKEAIDGGEITMLEEYNKKNARNRKKGQVYYEAVEIADNTKTNRDMGVAEKQARQVDSVKQQDIIAKGKDKPFVDGVKVVTGDDGNEYLITKRGEVTQLQKESADVPAYAKIRGAFD